MIWKYLTAPAQLEEIARESNQRTQLIFKHSTRCIISKMVLGNFERDFDPTDLDADLYFLDLIQYRTISDEIAQRFQVRHESPQVLTIRNGVVTHHDSHDAIEAALVKKWIGETP